MSKKQRQLLFMLAVFALLIGLQSLATAKCSDAVCQQVERQKILRDEQPKTQKIVAPIGGSTGPTNPPKPTQGNTHK
jgi:hypothetical protein